MQSTLTILITRDGSSMVARSLEHDIAAQGDTIAEALDAWSEVFAAQILLDIERGREPLGSVGPAPERCFELVRRALRVEAAPFRLPDGIPDPWMVAAMHPEIRAC